MADTSQHASESLQEAIDGRLAPHELKQVQGQLSPGIPSSTVCGWRAHGVRETFQTAPVNGGNSYGTWFWTARAGFTRAMP